MRGAHFWCLQLSNASWFARISSTSHKFLVEHESHCCCCYVASLSCTWLVIKRWINRYMINKRKLRVAQHIGASWRSNRSNKFLGFLIVCLFVWNCGETETHYLYANNLMIDCPSLYSLPSFDDMKTQKTISMLVDENTRKYGLVSKKLIPFKTMIVFWVGDERTSEKKNLYVKVYGFW